MEKDSKYYKKIVEENPNAIKDVPYSLRNKEICEIAYNANIRNFKYIPDEFKTKAMSEYVSENAPDGVLAYIPKNYITIELCEKLVERNYVNFRFVPKELRTQTMCEYAFDCSIYEFYFIPDKFKTQEMCNKAFKYDIRFFDKIPDKFKTQEMYEILFKENLIRVSIYKNQKNSSFYKETIKFLEENVGYVPKQFAKETYAILLKRDVYRFSKVIPQIFWDEDILGIVFIELKKIKEEGKKIPSDSNLCLHTANLYPELASVIEKDTNDKIKDDLYALLTNGSTAEYIAEKHKVSIQIVNEVLESIKEYDMEGYKAIRRVLSNNQNKYFFDIMNDVYKLGEIILSLGYINTKFLNIEQKIKFAYLYNKHVHHSLEEIYNFNYKKYDNKYAKILEKFFKTVLKYNYLADNYAMIPEKKTILFNNSWQKKYDRDKFFGIKDGVSTIESKFGQNQTVLTLETEQGIINILKENDIPLIDVIVRTAFKEYFDGTLSEYITKLKEYDTIFEEKKPKKM